jgi:hypothetical protein
MCGTATFCGAEETTLHTLGTVFISEADVDWCETRLLETLLLSNLQAEIET